MWNPERTAKCTAKIILPRGWFRQGRLQCTQVIIEIIVSIKEAVPKVVVCCAVPLIGARFRLKLELAARIAPVFRRVGRSLDTKFLEPLHRHKGLRCTHSRRSTE